MKIASYFFSKRFSLKKGAHTAMSHNTKLLVAST